jgi:hypothetical protein
MGIGTVAIGVEPNLKVMAWRVELGEEMKRRIWTIIEVMLKECYKICNETGRDRDYWNRSGDWL